MSASNSQLKEFREALGSCATSYQVDFTAEGIERLSEYYVLLTKWNPRLHLVAPCSPREFATRHVLESLLLLPHLPQAAKVADIGSGAGLPIIPCLIARPDITATLIESSKTKAVFLREALNRTETKSATVIAKRFEETATPDMRFITCRALEQFAAKLPNLIEWSPHAITLLLFGGEELRKRIAEQELGYSVVHLPNSTRRFLFIIKRP
ncbi:MAG TPA: 16S rRNA (guanine(527)-N(7))-methyltransferase RsmG [Pyrinomonadaceae bacterium]|nr:16S rRNA (guanine(527)-N(7))-methyltransferase RsmG [Pyrinomonadaceae bacterium]